MTASCSFPKTLLEAKLKSNGFISLVEEISRQTNIDSVTWLLLIALMQVYNKKKSKQGKKKYKMYNLERKKNQET